MSHRLWVIVYDVIISDSPIGVDVFSGSNIDSDSTCVKIINDNNGDIDYTGDDDSSGDDDNYADTDKNRIETINDKVDIQEVKYVYFVIWPL